MDRRGNIRLKQDDLLEQGYRNALDRMEKRKPQQPERSLLTASPGLPLDPCYDAVIFDFDGVLADTEPLHYTCWQRVFAGRSVALGWRDYTRVLSGYSGEELLARITRLFPRNISFDQIRTMYLQKKLLYRDLVASRGIVPDTVVAFVRRLPVPCALVTSSARVDVEGVLRRVGLLTRFAAIICCEDVDEPKPAPNGYKQALVALGVKRALAVEDSDAGVQSAIAAGLEVLRVPSPNAMPAFVANKLYGTAHF